MKIVESVRRLRIKYKMKTKLLSSSKPTIHSELHYTHNITLNYIYWF